MADRLRLCVTKITRHIDNTLKINHSDNMESQIAVSYPKTLAASLKMRDREFEREIKTISMVKLYELGKVSSGIAA
ncbi:MAG: UPF0175 family protein, partial [Spirochaetaceae bacterium]|nr:UPF0175 family protein [Spirochaetaceae bacterium]